MSNFEGKIYNVTQQAVKEVYGLDVGPDTLVVEVPRNKDNGDYATGVAMKLARELHKSPVEIAEAIAAKLRELLPEAESVTVAKPGFINFKLSSEALTSLINQVLDQGDNYGQNNSGEGVRILVEWVSANPTGDLHCGHARNAAWGDSICRLLEKSGYDVLREFYVNDAGNQIVMLGESLVSRYFEFFGKEYPLPENGYHADDVKQIAQDIAKEDGDKWLTADANERLHYFMQQGIDRELAKIDRDLKLYRVNITSWMHETFFYQNDMKRIKDLLPDSPPYFDKDQWTDKPARFFVTEIIREKILLYYDKEIPYAVEVVVEQFKEDEKSIHINVVIYVERESQKGIIIGKQGKALKKVATEARKSLEKFFGKSIYLETFVKVDKDWRSSDKELKNFGYNLD